MSTKVHDIITERIIALLEQGSVPWRKPWSVTNQMPRNLVSKKPYRGVNVFLLTGSSYESPFWLTFRQAIQLGGTVRKGEKACPVVFWKIPKAGDGETAEKRPVPLLRYYHVFNLAQCDKLAPSATETQGAPQTTVLQAEQVVTGMPNPPTIKHGMKEAFYSPREDVVGLPSRQRFDRIEEYYTALFHELVHSTGHEKRLKRATLAEAKEFGSDPYSKEELIAEMGAAFLCSHTGIVDRIIENSAAYIQGWLERLKNDRTLIVHAAAQAQKASDFILNQEPDEKQEATA